MTSAAAAGVETAAELTVAVLGCSGAGAVRTRLLDTLQIVLRCAPNELRNRLGRHSGLGSFRHVEVGGGRVVREGRRLVCCELPAAHPASRESLARSAGARGRCALARRRPAVAQRRAVVIGSGLADWRTSPGVPERVRTARSRRSAQVELFGGELGVRVIVLRRAVGLASLASRRPARAATFWSETAAGHPEGVTSCRSERSKRSSLSPKSSADHRAGRGPLPAASRGRARRIHLAI